METRVPYRSASPIGRVSKLCRALFLAVGVFFLIFTVAFFVIAGIVYKSRADFRESCQLAQATIVSVEQVQDPATGKTRFSPQLQFPLADGTQHGASLPGGDSPSFYAAGSTLDIMYKTDEPDLVKPVDDYYLLPLLLVGMGACSLLLTAVFMAGGFLLRRRAPKPGQPLLP